MADPDQVRFLAHFEGDRDFFLARIEVLAARLEALGQADYRFEVFDHDPDLVRFGMKGQAMGEIRIKQLKRSGDCQLSVSVGRQAWEHQAGQVWKMLYWYCELQGGLKSPRKDGQRSAAVAINLLNSLDRCEIWDLVRRLVPEDQVGLPANEIRRPAGQGSGGESLILDNPLTKREIEILQMTYSGGMSAKMIASRLGIGTRSVEKHLQDACEKIGFSGRNSRAKAGLIAAKNGWI
jgi:DNA-binding CsgD family transcriptional regulator